MATQKSSSRLLVCSPLDGVQGYERLLFALLCAAEKSDCAAPVLYCLAALSERLGGRTDEITRRCGCARVLLRLGAVTRRLQATVQAKAGLLLAC